MYASDGRYAGYQYDSFNRLLEMKEYVGGKVLETGYHYDDQSNHSYKTGLFRGIFLNGQRQIAYSYDDMSRRDKRVVMTAVPFVTEYTYYDGATSGTTSTVVKTLKNGSTTWEYAYDAVGNITSVKQDGTVVESYGYDALNQLTTVVRGADTYSYSYDASGNITAVTKNGSSHKSYTYGNSNWKDLLTAYNGTTITYDAIGNPLTYRDGFTFTWSSGRQLATAAKGGNTYSYTYDASGLRTSKTVGNTTTQYYWLGDKLQAQKTGNDYLIFLYDEAGMPYGLIHKYGGTEKKYYYEYNLQGDIIGIISDAGTRVVTYQYSAWGELLSTTGSMASNIGATNPLRYRGYYYDEETGLYYLQSRYYDPITGRFINADTLLSTGQGVLGYNMFAYCNNNPIMYADQTGDFPWLVVGIVVACIGIIALDHALAANQPDGGYAVVNETNKNGATKRGLYAQGNGFEVDANGITLFDTEVGLTSMYVEKNNSRFDILNCLTASAVAEVDWSGVPAVDVSAVASIYSPSVESTFSLGLFDVTITAEGHVGAIGAGIELDIDSGKFKMTPPFMGVGGTFGVDFDLNWVQ